MKYPKAISIEIEDAVDNDKKKYKAVFKFEDGKRRTTYFGGKGYEDFTMHRDNKRKKLYIQRHAKDLSTQDPYKAGYLSMFVLWNFVSLKKSIEDYKKRLETNDWSLPEVDNEALKGGKKPAKGAAAGGKKAATSGNRRRASPKKAAAGALETVSQVAGKVPSRYYAGLSRSDTRKQLLALAQSRKKYKEGVYKERDKLKSFKSKRSKHRDRVVKLYGFDPSKPITIKALAKKTKCSIVGLREIIRKGKGAFYSSGSRPNQTPSSWGIARMYSAVSGGNASRVDAAILKKYCKRGSKALTFM